MDGQSPPTPNISTNKTTRNSIVKSPFSDSRAAAEDGAAGDGATARFCNWGDVRVVMRISHVPPEYVVGFEDEYVPSFAGKLFKIAH
jgi:hypothetical protein